MVKLVSKVISALTVAIRNQTRVGPVLVEKQASKVTSARIVVKEKRGEFYEFKHAES